MPLKFRFALLTAALMLVLSVNALANSGEGAPFSVRGSLQAA